MREPGSWHWLAKNQMLFRIEPRTTAWRWIRGFIWNIRFRSAFFSDSISSKFPVSVFSSGSGFSQQRAARMPVISVTCMASQRRLMMMVMIMVMVMTVRVMLSFLIDSHGTITEFTITDHAELSRERSAAFSRAVSR